jgi:NADPH:quinone reductase-like Zn-dependent oxidoreductase
VNYKDEPHWGLAARKLTPNGEGFDIILEVGGPNTIGESLKAVKPGGDIHLIGFLGGVEQNPQATIWQARQAMCNLKSVVVGSRVQFEETNRAIEGLQLRPVVDESMFGFEQLRDAYQYLVSELSEKEAPTQRSNEFQMDGKHVGKVVVDID